MSNVIYTRGPGARLADDRPAAPASGDDLTLQVLSVDAEPEEKGRHRLAIKTSKGEIPGILHPCDGGRGAIVWVCGAVGGFDGPAGGIYADLGEALVKDGLTSLRLNYRLPNNLQECVLDTLGGVSVLKGIGAEKVALVGHSFGGAVVIAAGGLSPIVSTVVGLSSQTHGATGAGRLAPRSLLLVHGKEDTRLAPACSEQIYEWAQDPKELVLIPGAGHGLRECRDLLFDLLSAWLVDKLR